MHLLPNGKDSRLPIRRVKDKADLGCPYCSNQKVLKGVNDFATKYPKLLEDPVHKWRAKNGIELIHKEPDFQEQKRIFYR